MPKCQTYSCTRESKWKYKNKLLACDLHKTPNMKISKSFCCVDMCESKYKYMDMMNNRYCVMHKKPNSYTTKKCYIDYCTNDPMVIQKIKVVYCSAHRPELINNNKCKLPMCNHAVNTGLYCEYHDILEENITPSNITLKSSITNDNDTDIKLNNNNKMIISTRKFIYNKKVNITCKKYTQLSYCSSCQLLYENGNKRCCGIKRKRLY